VTLTAVLQPATTSAISMAMLRLLAQTISITAARTVTVNFSCQYSYNYLPYQLGSVRLPAFFRFRREPAAPGVWRRRDLVYRGFALQRGWSRAGAYSVTANPGAIARWRWPLRATIIAINHPLHRMPARPAAHLGFDAAEFRQRKHSIVHLSNSGPNGYAKITRYR